MRSGSFVVVLFLAATGYAQRPKNDELCKKGFRNIDLSKELVGAHLNQGPVGTCYAYGMGNVIDHALYRSDPSIRVPLSRSAAIASLLLYAPKADDAKRFDLNQSTRFTDGAHSSSITKAILAGGRFYPHISVPSLEKPEHRKSDVGYAQVAKLETLLQQNALPFRRRAQLAQNLRNDGQGTEPLPKGLAEWAKENFARAQDWFKTNLGIQTERDPGTKLNVVPAQLLSSLVDEDLEEKPDVPPHHEALKAVARDYLRHFDLYLLEQEKNKKISPSILAQIRKAESLLPTLHMKHVSAWIDEAYIKTMEMFLKTQRGKLRLNRELLSECYSRSAPIRKEMLDSLCEGRSVGVSMEMLGTESSPARYSKWSSSLQEGPHLMALTGFEQIKGKKYFIFTNSMGSSNARVRVPEEEACRIFSVMHVWGPKDPGYDSTATHHQYDPELYAPNFQELIRSPARHKDLPQKEPGFY